MIPAAKADLQDIWRYTVETWEEQQAENYVGTIKKACHTLIQQPQLGKALPAVHEELRVYRCQHHFIFYLTDSEHLIFIAFLHERMDMLKHLTARIE